MILDVVYNHTAEGNHQGPTISMRGIDNAAYYRLVDDDQQFYLDYTGTGNSLNVGHPHSLQLIMDSLRYWVTEMHVDGFRFDLAAALAREFYEVDRLSTFFELVQQDPIVSQVKLIAEPWDLGPGGYQVGNFPPQWTEWNGKYRDTVRDFWRGEPSTLGEFASRITGSSDLYENTGRRPVASINFVTAHDGFTLRDLVSYNEKHNDANGEGGNDGSDDNRSFNMGVEGETDDPTVVTLRQRQQRNFLATLLLSQGVPMILHGDELGRTQHGNNNVYAQDSEIAWVHWDEADDDLIEFTAALTRLRREHPTFRRSRFFDGHPVRRGEGEPLPDLVWLRPDGTAMQPEDWEAGFGRTIGVFLNGQGIRGVTTRGERIVDHHFLVYFNAHTEAVDIVIPTEERSPIWDLVVDTNGGDVGGPPIEPGAIFSLGAHALAVLREHGDESRRRRGDSPARRTPTPVPAAPTSTYRLQLTPEFTLRRRGRGRDTCETSGPTGTTSPPCCRRSRARRTGTTWSTIPDRHARVERRAARGRPRRRARRADRHRAEPHAASSDACGGTCWWDAIAGPNHILGSVGSASRSGSTRAPGRRRFVDPVGLRPAVSDAVGRRRWRTRRRCHGGSTTSCIEWRAATPTELPPVLHDRRLAGLRVELPEVFAATHARSSRWVRDGLGAGMPVGLRDRPPGWARRSRRLPRRPRRRHRGRLRGRREDPAARGGASRLGGRRHDRL